MEQVSRHYYAYSSGGVLGPRIIKVGIFTYYSHIGGSEDNITSLGFTAYTTTLEGWAGNERPDHDDPGIQVSK